jgi:glycosyltransferase involved in cell wall biosynthesis
MKIRIFDAGQSQSITSGYGLQARQYFANLKALGHEVVGFPDDGSGEDIRLWIRPPHYVMYPEFDHEKINVFFTMHETEKFEGWKSNWGELLNKCDAVIVPTQWNKKVFLNNGVKVPIYVVPLGVNPRDFHGHKTYRFSIMTLHNGLGSDSSRENWKDTIIAYYDAFYKNHHREVELTIKSYNIKYPQYQNFLDMIQRKKESRYLPMINVIDTDLVEEDLNRLYSKHWIFLKNANREGWCLPLWEAAAAGLRLVYADLPVYEDLANFKDKRTFKLGDTKELKDIMLDEFRHWKKRKGFVNAYTWKRSARKAAKVLQEVYEKSKKKT